MIHGGSSQLLDAAALQPTPLPRRIGRKVEIHAELDSTNNWALEHLVVEAGKESDGQVVFAEYQTAGRGRFGRDWLTPRGAGLCFTFILWESTSPACFARLIMETAIAVAEGIEAVTDVEVGIRWPNDLYVRGRKLAGILVELRGATGGIAIAVGVGVNCLQQPGHFPPELRDRATSLEIESHNPIDRNVVGRSVLTSLDRFFGAANPPSDEVLTGAWLNRSTDVGTHVTLHHDGHAFAGRILDISPKSGLLLQLDDGGRRLFDPATTSRND